MRYHVDGVKTNYVDFDFIDLEAGGDPGVTVSTSRTFRSINDIECIEVVGPRAILGAQLVTIQKLRTASIYDANPIVVTTLTGMDPG